MKFLASRRRIFAAAVVILLVLFLVRPGASRLKNRITNSISRAVARPSDIGSVHLRFLPRPGFDLENLVIYEDPAFGAEPMLRAPEVTAVVRLTSLLRGRLDISRLELTEPSLNLVQRMDGRWNLAALLERTAHTPLAPTAKAKSEARPGFPYIEATAGRINFKTGSEKKPYALLNADFALWQESENTWGVRLKAEPLRADMSLSDTGLLRMNGSWQRAGSLRETPLLFNVEWERAQLGQLTKLVTGNDKGWRGDVSLQAKLSGTPDAMLVAADGAIRDFHRYDIPITDSLGLATHCEGKYYSSEGMMRDITCLAPVAEGMVTLSGSAGRPGTHKMNLLLSAGKIPLSSVAQLMRRVKKNLPPDLIATGSMQGSFGIKEDSTSSNEAEFRGRGEILDLHVESAGAKAEFSSGTIPFILGAERDNVVLPSRVKRPHTIDSENKVIGEKLRIEYGPFPVALGRPVPAQARGWITLAGYAMTLRGEVEVAHALKMAALAGLPATKANVAGTAQIDVQIAGSWDGDATGTPSGFISPKLSGTAQLRNVRTTVRGINDPIEIASAAMNLLPTEVRVEKLEARFGNAEWTGTVTLPRGCGTPGACDVRFNLNTGAVEMHSLYAAFGSKPKERRWYEVLAAAENTAPSFLANLRATGTVNAARLRIREVVAEKVSASVDVDHGKLKIGNLRAEVLGGKHRGEWSADFAGAAPVYGGSGTVTGISLEQMADATHGDWISGTANCSYEFKSSAAESADFWHAAEGEIHFEARDGALPHVSLGSDDEPLRIARWKGSARLRGGIIGIEKSTLESPGGEYEISGTASLAQVLDLRLSGGPATTGTAVYSITGTLAEPHVALSPAAETQAELKH